MLAQGETESGCVRNISASSSITPFRRDQFPVQVSFAGRQSHLAGRGTDILLHPSVAQVVLRAEIADEAVSQMKSGMRVKIHVGYRHDWFCRRGAMALRGFWHQMIADSDP